jgi:SOS response regulatory protein OraA/RecX
MTKENIRSWINERRSDGYKDQQIKDFLIQKGYSSADVEYFFQEKKESLIDSVKSKGNRKSVM